MNTPESDLSLENALSSIPAKFRTRLIERYTSLKAAYTNADHDAAGLRAGKFCEVLLRYLQHELTGQHTPFGSKISNFGQECAKLEKVPKGAGDESLRVIMPRAINYLYTLRNKRGIGHEGGDVDANEIDAATCVRIADWCLCELIRLFNPLSLEEAQAILDAIAERQVPYVWSVAGKKRILDTSLSYKEQVLVLLYSDPETAVAAEDVFKWTGHSHFTVFRRDVLIPLHKQRLIEYDRDTEMVILSPRGAEEVEKSVLAKVLN